MNRKSSIIILITSIVCFFAILFIEFPCFRFLPELTIKGVDYSSGINEMIKGLSYSYLAGAIFYYLSVYLPFQSKRRIILYSILNSLYSARNLSDFFFMDTISLRPHRESKDYIMKQAMKAFANIRPTYCGQVREFSRAFLPLIDTITSYNGYLTNEELELINHIKTSYFFNIVEDFSVDGSIYSFSKKGFKNFMESAFENHFRLQEVIVKITKEIYNPKPVKKKKK